MSRIALLVVVVSLVAALFGLNFMVNHDFEKASVVLLGSTLGLTVAFLLQYSSSDS